MNDEQIRQLALNHVTNETIEKAMFDRVYGRLEKIFAPMMNEWNSILHRTARHYVSNALYRVIDDLRKKLMQGQEFPRWIVQRFQLDPETQMDLILV